MTAHTTHIDVAANGRIVAGAPRRMLRLEGAAVAAGALIAYTTTHDRERCRLDRQRRRPGRA